MVLVKEPSDQKPVQQPEGAPQFSSEFIAEVAECHDVDTFRDLLDRRGLWLNRKAALDVFSYLYGLATGASFFEGSISDENLAGVIGGVATDGVMAAPQNLLPLLTEIVRQL